MSLNTDKSYHKINLKESYAVLQKPTTATTIPKETMEANEEVVKCDLPNVPVDIPYENVYKHYRKWYADVIDQFVGS